MGFEVLEQELKELINKIKDVEKREFYKGFLESLSDAYYYSGSKKTQEWALNKALCLLNTLKKYEVRE